MIVRPFTACQKFTSEEYPFKIKFVFKLKTALWFISSRQVLTCTFARKNSNWDVALWKSTIKKNLSLWLVMLGAEYGSWNAKF